MGSKSRGRGFKSNANNNTVGGRTVEPRAIKGRDRPGPINIDSSEQEQLSDEIKSINLTAEATSYHQTTRQTSKRFRTLLKLCCLF